MFEVYVDNLKKFMDIYYLVIPLTSILTRVFVRFSMMFPQGVLTSFLSVLVKKYRYACSSCKDRETQMT